MGAETGLFTDEERVMLGEIPEPPKEPVTPSLEGGEKPPEGKETEQKEKPPEASEEEKQAMEAMGLRIDKGYIIDDDGTKIPAKRWKTMYRDFQEEKRGRSEDSRKFNLFKELGAEKYYELYPDEKPAGWEPPKKEPKAGETQIPALGSMVVQGGPHNGKTLNEVWQEDPAYASYLQTQYLNAERDRTETARQAEERIRQESENEVNAFSGRLSKEMFNKEADKLTAQEEKKVDDTIQTILNWMAKTKRGGGILADAYFLMNQENLLADARAKGGKEAIESLKKPVVPSISTGGGTAVTPFSAAEEMSSEQLQDLIEKMNDLGLQKFLKEAPQSLRAKHPSLPWS